MSKYNVSAQDVTGDPNAKIPSGKGPFNGTMQALIANSGIVIGAWPRTHKPTTVAELQQANPQLYAQVYASAQKMAQIKKYADDFGFFNDFRHMKQ